LERLLQAGLEGGAIDDGVVAESGAQRSALWALRERIPEAERADGASIKHDISVRIARIPEFLSKAESELGSIDHRLSVFGHIGDGNLHFNVLSPAGQSIAQFRSQHEREISDRIHEVAASLGGSFSAEHGIGQLKTGELERYESQEALTLMRTLKRALDPKGIMNPGKVLRDR
jgi:FAD/FMN-containing dehydrogenase